jgi:hypothetical protein
MAWSDVANKIKFFGSEGDGLDGLPTTVNGLAPQSATRLHIGDIGGI